jgi:hypothetical protein
MSFLRVTNPGAADINLYDIGVIIAVGASNVVLSDQFSVNDLVRSADLESAIIAADLTLQLNYGTGWQTIAAADYTNRDCLGTFLNVYEITNENNNEDLVDGSEVNASGPLGAALHIHDARYFTKTQLGAISGPTGGSLIGVDDASWSALFTFDDVQEFIDDLYTYVTSSLVTLDAAYTNDVDGILDINGVAKPLILRSNNTNDFVADRKSGANIQDIIRADVSANKLYLGSLVVGSLPQFDVEISSNLIVDGNITFTGSITDTTVNNLDVANEEILMRDGAASGGNAWLAVERGSSGADAVLKWDEVATRWKAGLFGSEETIALLERDEVVSGTWLFSPTPTTDPNFWLKDRAAAPSTGLGAATEIPIASIGNKLAIYDKTNSRNKWLSIDHEMILFTGRENNNNKNEYAYLGLVNTFSTGWRAPFAGTIVGLCAQTEVADTWTMRVRKNGAAANIASLAMVASDGATDNTLNVDFVAGDRLQVYIDGSGVHSPVMKVEIAQKF